tara:strand:+ start:3512 stop:3709 length:198 start_codon:yes stop_codon:yes gene_type:complete
MNNQGKGEVVFEDPSMTLATWKQFIQDQIDEHGYDAVMKTEVKFNPGRVYTVDIIMEAKDEAIKG